MAKQQALPAIVGLCPGEHLRHFYVPIQPGDSPICPECDKRMALYVITEDNAEEYEFEHERQAVAEAVRRGATSVRVEAGTIQPKPASDEDRP
jgi:hypothetical protein